MPTFSQRHGIKPLKKKIQMDDMDKELISKLWNSLYEIYWNTMKRYPLITQNEKIEYLIKRLWHNVLKEPIDTLWEEWSKVKNQIRKYFFECKWNERYDFIEKVVEYYDDEKSPQTTHNEEFKKFCNQILEEESAPYRFVGDLITPIISNIEIEAIEESLKSPLKPVYEHINASLTFLSDRKKPDYRNSIKEAISAVEYVCRKIANENDVTLTKALNKIETEGKIQFHPKLKKSLQELYWYTSDAEGIRHSLKDEKNLSCEDAKFMLVSCSAFTNYLIQKASKAGIKLT